MFMIMRIVVVLPAPLGPSRPNITPRGTRKERPSTALNRPKTFDTFSSSMAGFIGSGFFTDGSSRGFPGYSSTISGDGDPSGGREAVATRGKSEGVGGKADRDGGEGGITAGLRPALPTAGGLPLVAGSNPRRAIECARIRHFLAAERCWSGRTGRSRKPVSRKRLRGFESPPLRQSFAGRGTRPQRRLHCSSTPDQTTDTSPRASQNMRSRPSDFVPLADAPGTPPVGTRRCPRPPSATERGVHPDDERPDESSILDDPIVKRRGRAHGAPLSPIGGASRYRRARKKSWSSAALSSARTPPTTSHR